MSTREDAAMAPRTTAKEYPNIHLAMVELSARAESAAGDAGLNANLIQLAKIRAAQLNGCAKCLRAHVADAVGLGETTDRLAAVATWRESQRFSEQERAALELTEKVTRSGEHVTGPSERDVPEDTLTSAQITAVTRMVLAINAWTRIAIAGHYPAASSQ
jgi:AhpD family alkylhydroperoxidase